MNTKLVILSVIAVLSVSPVFARLTTDCGAKSKCRASFMYYSWPLMEEALKTGPSYLIPQEAKRNCRPDEWIKGEVNVLKGKLLESAELQRDRQLYRHLISIDRCGLTLYCLVQVNVNFKAWPRTSHYGYPQCSLNKDRFRG